MVSPVETAWVKIWDKVVGAIAWDVQKDHATFEFDPKFPSEDLDLAPIQMPLQEIRNGSPRFSFRTLPKDTFYGLPGMLADALPDTFGNSIIDVWLSRQGRVASDFSPVERLCYTGKRAMGALEFEPAINPELDASAEVDIEELLYLVQQVLNERIQVSVNLIEEPTDALLDIIRVGTSAGGMRPKAVIALNETTGEIRSGQVKAPNGFGYWILKFDGIEGDSLGNPQGYGQIEYAYYRMAKAAGIEMMESRLHREEGRAHFLTRRFDRTDSGDRLHLQSLCAIRHFDFNSPGSYSYEQAFETIRQLKLSFNAIEQQYRRMVFNVVSRNLDDHTKNIAFLMDSSGFWRLAPAFDVIYAYNPTGLWTQRHQMSINGKSEHITRADLEKVGSETSIKMPRIIIDEIVDIVARWPEFAEMADLSDSRTKEVGGKHLLL